MDRVLYFHAARADRLLHDVVTEIILPMHLLGKADVGIARFQKRLTEWIEKGLTTTRWSESTTRRVAQGLLSTLRDFGLLDGATHKRIAPVFLPVAAFAYVAFYLKRDVPSGAKLLEHSDWQLFLLSREDVERLLFEAHQRDLLEYNVAGSVNRLTFPASALEEYANVQMNAGHVGFSDDQLPLLRPRQAVEFRDKVCHGSVSSSITIECDVSADQPLKVSGLIPVW
jgi:hypothetical protein